MKSLNSVSFWLSFAFGTIGIGYLVYGRKQKKIIPFLVGIALSLYTYFIDNISLIILIGIILMFIPKFIKE